MPPFVRQAWESYGWDKATASRPIATIEQITRMEEAIQWLLWISDKHERTAVWVMAQGNDAKVHLRLAAPSMAIHRRRLSLVPALLER